MPPDWVGTHFVEPHEGIADRPLVPGMVFNLENQFDVWAGWPGGTGAAYIESFVMTDGGLEILSKLPRNLTELYRAGATIKVAAIRRQSERRPAHHRIAIRQQDHWLGRPLAYRD